MAAALFAGNTNPHALPDSGTFAATSSHPAMVLNFTNADGTGFQTHPVNDVGTFTFSVPQRTYSKMFIVLTSSEGASTITVTLTYTDAVETRTFVVPDYYNDIPGNDTDFCYVAHDLAKWGPTNNMTETSHHNIDGFNVHPNAGKSLKTIKVDKTAAGYLVFWGATGVATGASRVNDFSGHNGGSQMFENTRVFSREASSIRFTGLSPNTRIKMFSASGCLVAEAFSCGKDFTLDARHGTMSPGVYLCEMQAGAASRTTRVAIGR
jgi:hypothetical protein